jgi:hypothetical protein
MIGRGNRSTRRKPAPVPLCPPQTPHSAHMRTRATAVGSQRLTAGYGTAISHLFTLLLSCLFWKKKHESSSYLKRTAMSMRKYRYISELFLLPTQDTLLSMAVFWTCHIPKSPACSYSSCMTRKLSLNALPESSDTHICLRGSNTRRGEVDWIQGGRRILGFALSVDVVGRHASCPGDRSAATT